jgi:hypothetical protein
MNGAVFVAKRRNRGSIGVLHDQQGMTFRDKPVQPGHRQLDPHVDRQEKAATISWLCATIGGLCVLCPVRDELATDSPCPVKRHSSLSVKIWMRTVTFTGVAFYI